MPPPSELKDGEGGLPVCSTVCRIASQLAMPCSIEAPFFPRMQYKRQFRPLGFFANLVRRLLNRLLVCQHQKRKPCGPQQPQLCALQLTCQHDTAFEWMVAV